MRRTLLVITILFVVTLFAGTGFAAEEEALVFGACAAPPAQYVILGEQLEFFCQVFEYDYDTLGNPVVTDVAAGFPVDVSLYRPSTTAGWPLGLAQTAGTGFAVIGESEIRRQSWPKDAAADEFGIYAAKFMLPRDEAWYPCGYPCRWDCNYFDPITGWEYHSPLVVIGVYKSLEDLLFYPLYWPYAAMPQDTVHPLTAWLFQGDTLTVLRDGPLSLNPADPLPNPWIFEYEVDGYFWKTSDLEVDYPGDYPAVCPWQLP